MSTINCDSCANLREYAPVFVQNGVTDVIAASLKNNTGLSPSLTVVHDNCEDLNDANDCLIGRMRDEIESYDVCDWKEFMGKLLPNQYEVLKAIIAGDCGQWARIEGLCTQIALIQYLMRGGVPNAKEYLATWTPEGYAMFNPAWQDRYAKSDWIIGLRAGDMSYVDCNGASTCRTTIEPFVRYPGPIRPGDGIGPAWTLDNYSIGDIIATFDKSLLVPAVFNEEQWTRYKVQIPMAYPQTGNTQLDLYLRGYTEINGMEYNADLKDEYGADTLVLYVGGVFVTSSNTSSGIGNRSLQRTYQFSCG